MALFFVLNMSRKAYIPVTATLLILLAVIVAERFFLGAYIYGLVKNSQSTVLGQILYDHGKAISRIATLAAFMLVLLSLSRIKNYASSLLNSFSVKNLIFLPPQLAALISLYFLSGYSFGTHPSAALQVVWVLLCMAGVVFTLLCFAGLRFWTHFIRCEYQNIIFSVIIALLVWWLSLTIQDYWDQFIGITFSAVVAILDLVSSSSEIFVNTDERVIGIGSFLIEVAPECSGYEGMVLITGFSLIYLYSFRGEFRFPHALLILPIGLCIMWCFNILRIVALILLGAHWSEGVAVWGFHAQAGWIAFIVASLVLLWLMYRVPFFREAEKHELTGKQSELNLPTATLLPLIALLATTIVTEALSAGFVWLYPLRVLVTAAVILYCFKKLDLFPLKVSYLSVAGGISVAILWFILVSPNIESDGLISTTLSESAPVLSAMWLVFRVIGAVVTVPIAEELAFRAYLLCRLSSTEVSTRGAIPFSLVGFFASSLAFGLLHGDWLGGAVAGLIYAFVRYKSKHILDAIVAHSITNALIFVYALVTGYWSLM